MADDFDIDMMRGAAAEGSVQWHQHALERFLERGISRVEVMRAIMNGEVIEVYPTDRPYPSCLIRRGRAGARGGRHRSRRPNMPCHHRIPTRP
jgi:hypothetical protein